MVEYMEVCDNLKIDKASAASNVEVKTLYVMKFYLMLGKKPPSILEVFQVVIKGPAKNSGS